MKVPRRESASSSLRPSRNPGHRGLAALLLAASLAISAVAGGAGIVAPWPAHGGPRALPASSAVVTPVEGPSVIEHLRIPFDDAPFGRVGAWGPAPFPNYQAQLELVPAAEVRGRPFALSGADVYRLSCQSCHKPDGNGLPPVVKSVIGPVQATSAALVRERMKARGFTPDAAMVRQLTSQARAAIHDRLEKGGEMMPAFPYLRGVEVDALLAYLDQLAGIPGAESRQIRFTEPEARVGELLVKGTCHICHSATGPGPEALARAGDLDGIPSLASFPEERREEDVLHKVRLGVTHHPAGNENQGRMPVFDYLTEAEVSAVYRYLVDNPPLGPSAAPPPVLSASVPANAGGRARR